MPKKTQTTLIITVICISIILVFFLFNPPSGPSIDELLQAPEQIEIEGRKYILDSNLNRDFFPPAPPNGRELTASITITAVDEQAFPSSINAYRLWIIKDPENAWETVFTSERRDPDCKHQLKKGAKGGPKWGPYILVDVVVRVMQGSNSFLLRASNQTIHQSM